MWSDDALWLPAPSSRGTARNFRPHVRLCGQAELAAEREHTAQARNQDTTAKLAQSNSAKRAARAREMETTFGAASLLQDYQVC